MLGLLKENGIKNRDKIRSFKFQVYMQQAEMKAFSLRNKSLFKRFPKIRFLNDYLNNSWNCLNGACSEILKKIVIYSQCDLFQTIINHPHMLSFPWTFHLKKAKWSNAESMRQSLTPIREKLKHISRNLTPCLKFIFEGSALSVTTCLKSFLLLSHISFTLC